MNFKKLVLNKYLYFQDVSFSLENRGLHLITGENGVGKSLMFSPLILLSQLTMPEGKMVNDLSKTIDISLIFEKDSKKHTLSFKNGKIICDVAGKNILPSRKPDIAKKLSEIFPSPEIMGLICYISPFSLYQELISGSQARRATILEKFVDFSVVDKYKAVLAENRKQINEMLSEKPFLIDAIAETEKELKELTIEKPVSDVFSLKKTKKRLKKEKELHENSLNVGNIPSIQTAKKKRSKLKKLRNSLSETKEKISGIETILDVYIKNKPDLFSGEQITGLARKKKISKISKKEGTKAYKRYETIKQEMPVIAGELRRLSSLKDGECPTCGTKTNVKEVEKKKLSFRKQLETLETEKETLMTTLSSYNAIIHIHDTFKQRNIMDKDITRYKNKELDLSKIEEEIDKLEDIIAGKIIKTTQKEYKKAGKEYKKAVKAYDKAVKDWATYEYSLDLKKSFVKKLEKQKKRLNKIVEIEPFQWAANESTKLISSRSFKSTILASLCEDIIDNCNEYAHMLFDDITFSVGTELGYPSMLFKRESMTADVRFLSSAQKKLFSLLLLPTFLALSKDSTNILVLDEIDANTSVKNRDRMLSFLSSVNIDKDSIFFITPNAPTEMVGTKLVKNGSTRLEDLW